MHPIAERIYNSVIDQLTLNLSKRGFTVAISQSYPDDGESKYIIWQRREYPQFYLLLIYNKDEGYLELYNYDEGDISQNGTEGLLDPSYPYWCHEYHENLHIFEENPDDYTSEDEEEFINYCINNLVSMGLHTTYVVTPEYNKQQKKLPPPPPDPEEEYLKQERKSKRKRYAWVAGHTITIILILLKIVARYNNDDDSAYNNIPQTQKELTKEQMEKVMQMYKIRNDDSVLMKDTNGTYYRFKKRLEAMDKAE